MVFPEDLPNILEKPNYGPRTARSFKSLPYFCFDQFRLAAKSHAIRKAHVTKMKESWDLVKAHLRDPDDALALAKVFGNSGATKRALANSKASECVSLLQAQESKLDKRVWKQTPWDGEAWAHEGNPLFYFHLAHVSQVEPLQIAYNASVDKLRRDIQIRIKPGRYLSKFYPELSDERIRTLVHKFEADNQKNELTIIDNSSAKAWVEAYSFEVQASDSSSTSCMMGRDCVSIYAYSGNDLCLLVIWKEDAVIARAVANSETKEYVRAYTNYDKLAANTFIQILHDAGWSPNDACLEGSRLVRIESSQTNKFKCPYIDGEYQSVRDNGTHLQICEGDSDDPDIYEATNQDGWTSEGLGPVVQCDDCGTSMDEDEGNYSEYHDNSVCNRCNRRYVMAYADPRHRNHTDLVKVDECVSVNGSYYVADLVEEFGFQQCDWSDDWFDTGDMTGLACGVYVAEENFESAEVVRLAETSLDENSDWAYRSTTVTLEDGRVVYQDDKLYWENLAILAIPPSNEAVREAA